MDSSPEGTRKPTLPPGTQAPTLATGSMAPTVPPGATAPTLPPGPKAPSLPPGARPPAGPPKPEATGDGAGAVSRKDFATDQDVRWCPGCGDYAILATVQRLMPELGIPRENIVFISGIGCSSRFPYYMNTFGMHTIHGRAPTIATGLKASRPELDIWVVTGDGDGLSIGGNHMIHLMRRNVNLQLLLFNNQIYGLTKGQYSPTSESGKITKSSPYGTIDHPFNPIALVLGADASFVGRSMDRDPKHMKDMLKRSHDHRGTAFLEIYQNCNIFNDGAFFQYTEKDTKPERALFIEHGKPLVYAGGTKGLRLEGFHLESVDLEGGRWSASDCLAYDETSYELASIVGRLFRQDDMPQPFGVFYAKERVTYEDALHAQMREITEKTGKGRLADLLHAGDTWEVA